MLTVWPILLWRIWKRPLPSTIRICTQLISNIISTTYLWPILGCCKTRIRSLGFIMGTCILTTVNTWQPKPHSTMPLKPCLRRVSNMWPVVNKQAIIKDGMAEFWPLFVTVKVQIVLQIVGLVKPAHLVWLSWLTICLTSKLLAA